MSYLIQLHQKTQGTRYPRDELLRLPGGTKIPLQGHGLPHWSLRHNLHVMGRGVGGGAYGSENNIYDEYLNS